MKVSHRRAREESRGADCVLARLAAGWSTAAGETQALADLGHGDGRRVRYLTAGREVEAALLAFRAAEGRWPTVEGIADAIADGASAPCAHPSDEPDPYEPGCRRCLLCGASWAS